MDVWDDVAAARFSVRAVVRPPVFGNARIVCDRCQKVVEAPHKCLTTDVQVRKNLRKQRQQQEKRETKLLDTPATKKQLRFIKTLLEKNSLDQAVIDKAFEVCTPNPTTRTASAAIQILLGK